VPFSIGRGGDVRGDAALTARLLLRGTGLAGLTVTVGGALAVIAASRPWYRAVADLTMLGEQQGRTVASLAGAPATPWGWGAVLLGVAAAVLGTSIALDRPQLHARRWLLAIAAALAVLAGAGYLLRPGLAQVAGSDGEGLRELAERLPTGVELTLAVRPGSGPLLLLVAAAIVAVGAVLADDG
jgi:hypothetical protein